MLRSEGSFAGAHGTQLYYRSLLPAASPKAVVILLHGLGDHSGGMQTISRHLCEHLYATYAFDLRGHGKSPGTRGYVRSWEDYRGDLHAFRHLVRELHPDLPLFLVAHSLGGLISLDYCLHEDAGLAGLVVIAPALSYTFKPIEKWLIFVMCCIKPDYTVEKPVHARHDRSSERSGWTHGDPLRHQIVTPGLGRGMITAQSTLKKRAAALRVPFFLQYGTQDRVTPPQQLLPFFEAVGSKDKQQIAYANMRHRPFDEEGNAAFLADLLKWLDERCSPPPSNAGNNNHYQLN